VSFPTWQHLLASWELCGRRSHYTFGHRAIPYFYQSWPENEKSDYLAFRAWLALQPSVFRQVRNHHWFTKSDKYTFNLDPVRVPQKYPGKKHFKGPNAGKYSCNPLGKNPGDLWVIPNVKSNHIEKTEHPCQFPVELIERFVLSMTNEDDWVLDPFLGTGTTIIAAIRHNRRGAGAETVEKYVRLARNRIQEEIAGTLRTRPMHKPVYDPEEAGNSLRIAPWADRQEEKQLRLLEKRARYTTK